MIEVLRVGNKKELNRFIEFPYSFYKGYPRWVAPLRVSEKETFDRSKNPFFRHADVCLFNAYKDGIMAGRIAAAVNFNHNDFHDEKVVFFGFFESADDEDVSAALLSAVLVYGRDAGMDIMRGPMNFSTNDTCGMLYEGFDHDPVAMMPYNPEYYNRLMSSFGMQKAKDLYSYRFVNGTERARKLTLIGEQMSKRGNYEKRGINKKNIHSIMGDFKEIYDLSWEKNWGFVPMTEAELVHLADAMKDLVEPELAFILYHEGRPIGTSLSLSDYNQAIKHMRGRLTLPGIIRMKREWKKIDTARNLVMGVIPQYRRRGVELILIAGTISGANELGIQYGDLGWILEDNEMMNRELLNIGSERYKVFRIYEKRI